MSLLTVIEPTQAEGQVAEIYGQVEAALGMVPNALKMSSVSPALLEEKWRGISYILQHPTLSGPLFTMIRLLVSVKKDCKYCVDLNTAMLVNHAGLSMDEVDALKANSALAPLEAKEKALLLFALETIDDSNGVEAADIEKLKALGCTESEIFDALHHAATQVAGDIMLNAFKVDADM